MSKNKAGKFILMLSIISIFLVMVVLVSDGHRQGQRNLIHSSFNPAPQGVKALYLLLKETGFNVVRRQKGVETLFKSSVDSLIFLSVAPDEPYRNSEIDSLKTLIQQGASVILFYNSQLDSVILKFGIKTELTVRDSFYMRQQLLYSNFLFDSLYAGSDSSKEQIGLMSVFQCDSILYQPLYGTDNHSAVITVPYGKGELVVFNSPDYITNMNIDRYQNINIFMNILCWTADGKVRQGRSVIFDEYHQGYKEFESVITILDELPVRIALFLLITGLLFMVYSKSIRITRSLPVQIKTIRDSKSYLDSVTQAYRRSGAYRLSIHIWYQWIRRRLTQRYKTTLEDRWSRYLSEQFGFDEMELNHLFKRLNELQIEKKLKFPGNEAIRKREPLITDDEIVYYFRLLNKINATKKSKKSKNS